jgi:translation initiation factor 2 alpha subunit (eIF-2alpha)
MPDTKKLPDTVKRRPPAAGKGRPKGATNKLTKSIKEAIEAAFQGVGGPEYLMRQAEENPQAFMTLLGKIIPNQIQQTISNPDGSLKPTAADLQIAVLAALAKKHSD